MTQEHEPTAGEADRALDLYAAGELPLTLAAMRAVLASPDPASLQAAIARARARWGGARLDALAERLDEAAQARVREIASALDHRFRDADPAVVLARMAQGFDRAAAVSPDAGVALYSLGDAALLQEATQEVVAWLRAERLVVEGSAVLEVGCGAGRFLQALEPVVGLRLGVEISQGMAAEAVRRLGSSAPVVRGSGADLGFLRERRFDLVLFADSFPYLVQAGGGLPGRMLAEGARVLRPGGRIAVLNWSYRGDPTRDAYEAAELAHDCGLEREGRDAPGFQRWDASAFTFRRSPD